MGLWGRWSTYLEQSSCNYSGNQNPSCFQKTVETVLDRLSRVLDIALTVDVLVKHPRSGLPPTGLYNLSYLHYIISENISTGTKMNIIKARLMSVAMYASETWTLKKQDRDRPRLLAFEMKNIGNQMGT